jgi:DNA-binding transcriptional ArsR family regulator
MPDLAEHHYPPNSTDAGVAPDVEDFREQVREYCRYRRDEQGNAYVTATKVTREFDVTPQKAGAALAKLTEAGALSTWKDDARRTTYRITLDDTGGRDE